MSVEDTAGQGTSGSSSTPAGRAETTTHNVKRLIARHSLLAASHPDAVQSTDTLNVMLRVEPGLAVLLMVDDEKARHRIHKLLTAMSVDVLEACGPDKALQLPTNGPAMLVTDDLEFVRCVRAGPRGPRILFLAADEHTSLADALLAGADDCIGLAASSSAMRARLMLAYRNSCLETSFRSLLRENRKLSTTDPLTKVANRHFFAQHFPLELDRAARYRHAFSLILCDIDHFKQVNDTHGHLAGDAVLREFGTRLQQSLRQGADWVARIGGEEFAIVLPETTLESGSLVARKLHDCIRARHFRVKETRIPVTASFGLCSLAVVPAQVRRLAERLQTTADAALYRSKREGRDRVTVVAFESRGLLAR